MTDSERYAEKISKLLRKAESTTAEEAELLLAKAQELMTMYAIDEEMLARIKGDQRQERDHVVEEHIDFTGTYRKALRDIGTAIATANDCRTLINEFPTSTDKRGRNVYSARLYVVGFSKDVSRVHMLNASLQIQAAVAMRQWWKAGNMDGLYSQRDTWMKRRSFIYGFAQGVRDKLWAAKQRGEAAAQANAVARDPNAGSDAVGLMLRDKRSQVNDWVDKTYGRSLRSVRGSYNTSSGGGFESGRAAGRSSDTGDRVGGVGRKGLSG